MEVSVVEVFESVVDVVVDVVDVDVEVVELPLLSGGSFSRFSL